MLKIHLRVLENNWEVFVQYGGCRGAQPPPSHAHMHSLGICMMGLQFTATIGVLPSWQGNPPPPLPWNNPPKIILWPRLHKLFPCTSSTSTILLQSHALVPEIIGRLFSSSTQRFRCHPKGVDILGAGNPIGLCKSVRLTKKLKSRGKCLQACVTTKGRDSCCVTNTTSLYFASRL